MKMNFEFCVLAQSQRPGFWFSDSTASVTTGWDSQRWLDLARKRDAIDQVGQIELSEMKRGRVIALT